MRALWRAQPERLTRAARRAALKSGAWSHARIEADAAVRAAIELLDALEQGSREA